MRICAPTKEQQLKLRVAAGKETSDPAYRDYVRRAEEIISELRLSLDHGPSPELSANLENLYLFCEREISQAHREFFGYHVPAMSLLGVNALVHPEMLVEIEVDAVVQ